MEQPDPRSLQPEATDADRDPLGPGLDDGALAAALVRRATALAARIRAAGLDTDRKTGFTDIVTSADVAAERLVTGTLARLRPDDGLLGEEGASRASKTGRTWVVDPVDGTWNFATGVASWCSALALVEGDPARPVLGAVHRPDVAETWLGGPGRPTRCNDVAVAGLDERPLAEVTLGTYAHPSTLDDPDVREPWLSVVGGAATLRVLGSASVDLTSVAAGRLGAWAQHTVAPWDWLPGKALVEAAGGSTAEVDHRGRAWRLAGNPRALGELRDRLLRS